MPRKIWFLKREGASAPFPLFKEMKMSKIEVQLTLRQAYKLRSFIKSYIVEDGIVRTDVKIYRKVYDDLNLKIQLYNEQKKLEKNPVKYFSKM